MTTGHVTAVTRQVQGDELIAAAAISATTLYVNDVADFDEDGGSLRVGSLVYEYVGIDDDAATIDLAVGLTVAALTDDRVDLWDPETNDVIVEYVADVTEDGGEDGDPIQAVIPHALIDLLPEGVRGEVGESVEMVDDGGDGYEISAVNGKVPVVDGSFLDPTTIPDPIPDPAPTVPTGLGLTSAVSLVGRSYQSSITAAWSAVTTDVNGDPVGTLAGYDLQIKAGNLASSQPWQNSTSTTSLTATLNGFVPGSTWCIRVRAHLASGPSSAWSAAVEVTTAADTTAPNAPSTPAVSSRLGALVATWDGKDNAAAAMAADLAYVEVHVSTTNGFTPTAGNAATLLDRFTGPGSVVKGNATYGTTYYVKLLAVDYAGNASTASAQASTAVQPLVDVSNFPDDAMETLYARTGHFLVVTTDMLDANSAAVDFLDAGVLTGVLYQTTATAARGIKVDSTRFRAWDGTGTPTFTIDAATGAVTMLGSLTSGSTVTGAVVTTAASGERVVLRNDGSGGIVEFFAGLASETAGVLDPASYDAGDGAGPRPNIRMESGTTPTFLQSAYIKAFAGKSPLSSTQVSRLLLAAGNIDLSAANGIAGTGIVSLGGRAVTISAQESFPSAATGKIALNGIVDVTQMGAGSLGTGTFRDAVDARVLAVGATTEAALTTTASPTSTTSVTLAGMSTTVTSPGTAAVYTVKILADVAITTAGSTDVIELLVDGTAQTRIMATGRAGAGTSRGMYAQEWQITGLSAGSHTFTARTRLTAAGGADVTLGNTVLKTRRDS